MSPDWRAHYPVVLASTYLASHEQGAMNLASSDLLARFAEEWAGLASDAWITSWSSLPFEVGDMIGALIGASPGTTTGTGSLTAGLAAIDSCFLFPAAQSRFVTSQLDRSPGRRYWRRQAGLEESIVRSWDSRTIATETLIAAIDERTAVVMLSHGSPDSIGLDLKRIVAAAHDVDGYVVLDCSPSAGAVAVDVEELGVDFAVGRNDGWLCGGTTSAWLYVHPEIIEQLTPRTVGWHSDGNPAWPEPEVAGIGKFLDGPPDPAALYAAKAGIDAISLAGIAHIRASSLTMTGVLNELLIDEGVAVTSDTSQDRGPVVTVQIDGAADVARTLRESGIFVGVSAIDELSIGPHFYNNLTDIHAFVERLRDARE